MFHSPGYQWMSPKGRLASLRSRTRDRSGRRDLKNGFLPTVFALEGRPLLAPVILNPSFEVPPLAPGTFQYMVPVSATQGWTFNNGTGESANGSGFTDGQAAPNGNQVAFVQGHSTFLQTVSGFEAGTTYQISFSTAQRANFNQGGQTYQVLVDRTKVGTFTPSSTSYTTVTTTPFTVTAGAHTISFVGLNPNNGDNTAFIDNVTISTTTPTWTIGNPGFETPVLANGTFQYMVPDTWTFFNGSGISANNSGFTDAQAAPQGNQVGFIQGTSTFQQSITFTRTGIYTLSFQAAQRRNFQESMQDFEVLVDGNSVGIFTPPSTNYTLLVTNPFTISTTGSHLVQFVGLNSISKTNPPGDNTAFVDDVQINRVT